ncbi:hypothetical protein LZQ00_04545 [Sphingobacterium sp. SRCM116780]|uniref:DUF7674 family protein n=1 Tax=Sphingobacterium sp. SRCM116780 TaxID=2907623 RepID=UPI001F25C997|nr:hypothetical protein [Sphingobacterium sp. SRCM116780]UIR57086.1 hypothetical protein LZQ00_04545 [Sphingobacterium sp. SRCM116780]
MKTKMIRTIQEWIPETANWFSDEEQLDTSLIHYRMLQELAQLYLLKMHIGNIEGLTNAQEIAKVVNLLYQTGNQYTRNAIENEFLTNLLRDERPGSLKKHMDMLPKELREEYLKTILEN